MNKIREYREKAGLTRQQMADIFGMPKRTIENWEGGQREPSRWVEKLVIAELERIAEKNGAE